MSQIKVTINNRPYKVACDDGQEEHLHKLAGFLNGRVNELSSALGQIGDANLLLMAGLLLYDEISDANAEVAQLKEKLAISENAKIQTNPMDSDTDLIVAAADRINAMTDKLEGV